MDYANQINDSDEFEKLSPRQQKVLLSWCEQFTKIKAINSKRSSYGMKHIFESSKDGFYVTNGQFKGAMLKAGFKYKSQPYNPNWHFNISEKSISRYIEMELNQ